MISEVTVMQMMIEDCLDREHAVHPGTLLREICRETQAELADMLGVSRFTVNQIMTCRRIITTNMAMRLEKVGYGAAREWLIVQMEYDLEMERRQWK